jgi:predicted transcriptional regulator
VLSYNLKKLEKKKLIGIKRLRSVMTRYYPITVKFKESDILDYLLPATKRKIILFLVEHGDKCTFKEIVSYINRAPSTTSQYLKKLSDVKIISVYKDDNSNQIYYRLRNKMTTYKIVSKYLKRW